MQCTAPHAEALPCGERLEEPQPRTYTVADVCRVPTSWTRLAVQACIAAVAPTSAAAPRGLP